MHAVETMDSLLDTFASLAALDSLPAMVAAAVFLLMGATCLLTRCLMERRRQVEMREQIARLAAQVTTMARQVAAQAPTAKETIRSLRIRMDSQDKLKDEEHLLDDLVVRARVLASAANADAQAEAIKALRVCELSRRLKALQLDARRMRGIWDTLEATAWVLRRSEAAIRRSAQGRQPEPAALRA